MIDWELDTIKLFLCFEPKHKNICLLNISQNVHYTKFCLSDGFECIILFNDETVLYPME